MYVSEKYIWAILDPHTHEAHQILYALDLYCR